MGNSVSSFAPLDEEVVAQWLDSLDLSSSTKNTYKRAFKSFCAFVSDTSLDFDTLTKRDIVSFREYLAVDKRLKPTTEYRSWRSRRKGVAGFQESFPLGRSSSKIAFIHRS